MQLREGVQKRDREDKRNKESEKCDKKNDEKQHEGKKCGMTNQGAGSDRI